MPGPEINTSPICETNHWGKNLDLLPLIHGNGLPFEYINRPELASTLQNQSGSKSLSLDGYLASLYAFYPDKKFITQPSDDSLLSTVKGSDVLLFTDFLSRSGSAEYDQYVSNRIRTIGTTTFTTGVCGAVFLLLKQWNTRYKEKHRKNIMLDRRQLFKAVYLTAVISAGMYGFGVSAENLSTSSIAQAQQNCTSSIFMDISDRDSSSSFDYADVVARTAIANHKADNIPNSQFEMRGFEAPKQRFAVWGESHLLPSVLKEARKVLESPREVVDKIIKREAKYLIEKGFPQGQTELYLNDLILSIMGSLFIKKTVLADGSFLLEPVPAPIDYNPPQYKTTPPFVGDYYYFDYTFEPYASQLNKDPNYSRQLARDFLYQAEINRA